MAPPQSRENMHGAMKEDYFQVPAGFAFAFWSHFNVSDQQSLSSWKCIYTMLTTHDFISDRFFFLGSLSIFPVEVHESSFEICA